MGRIPRTSIVDEYVGHGRRSHLVQLKQLGLPGTALAAAAASCPCGYDGLADDREHRKHRQSRHWPALGAGAGEAAHCHLNRRAVLRATTAASPRIELSRVQY